LFLYLETDDSTYVTNIATAVEHIRVSFDKAASSLLVPLSNELILDSRDYHDHLQDDKIRVDNEQQDSVLINENISPRTSEISLASKSKSTRSTNKSLVHRLTFPARLGRLVFDRRIYSDSDIYQKICSKDAEIEHNVYHLDTIRDYAMEFYMLTSYGSDSQLRAWLDSNGDDIVDTVCYWDDKRYQSIDDEQQLRSASSESLIQQEELDWYSELDAFSTENYPYQQQQVHILDAY
jgi:hypothetical protein